MPRFSRAILLWILSIYQCVSAVQTSLGSGRKSIRDIRLELESRQLAVSKQETDPASLYPAYNLSIPIDHFHNESRYEPHSNGTFDLRYWFDASYYQPGGPVIIIQGGETNGADRLPFLQKGILHRLAEATHGIGVVLEHRYYGESFPTSDLSTSNLRFLSTEQALADEAYFAQNIRFPGLVEYGDLSSNTTAYIAYGGSYAGGFSAFLRVIYPDVFWGAVASSGVTEAIYDYWQYWDPIADYGPPDCIAAQQGLTHIVDTVLYTRGRRSFELPLRRAFGLLDLTETKDFADVLARGISGFQSLNWDPSVSYNGFYAYCANVTSTEVLYPDTEAKRESAEELISHAGFKATTNLTNQLLNYIGYVNVTTVAPCAAANLTQDQCFSNYNSTFYEQDSLDQFWRPWAWQYCTEWGYLQTGSGTPPDQLPLISRTLDLPYEMLVCNYAFGIYDPPDVNAVNKYGGYNISYERLAFIDGEWDPWRPATPHGFGYGALERKSTLSEPFIMIAGGIHHFDENGRFANETTPSLPPAPVADAQKHEVMFVQEWMKDWSSQRSVIDLHGHQQPLTDF